MKSCCSSSREFTMPHDDTHELQRLKCTRPVSRVITKTPAVGYIPYRMHNLVPRLKDHEVENHVIQARPHTEYKSKHYDGCGPIVRFPGSRCCTDDRANQGSGDNPTCAPVSAQRRQRVLDLAKRPRNWCTMRESNICPYSNACPISTLLSFRDGCPRTKRPKPYKYHNSNTRMEAEWGYNVAFWLKNLRLEIDHMEKELTNMAERSDAIERVMCATEKPFKNCTNSLVAHSYRKSQDKFKSRDELDDALCKERMIITKARERLDYYRNLAFCQIERNLKHLNDLYNVLEERHELKPGENCQYKQDMKQKSTYVGLHPGVGYSSKSVLTSIQVVQRIKENVRASRLEREKSEKLCNKIQKLMSAAVNDIWQHSNVSNAALDVTLEQTQAGIEELKSQRNEVVYKLDQTDQKLALTRHSLDELHKSPMMSMCKNYQLANNLNEDFCYHTEVDLINEDGQELCKNIERISGLVKKNLCDRKQLMAQCHALEQAIKNKEDDYRIDSEVCVPLRQQIHIPVIDPPVMHNTLKDEPSHC